MGFLSLSERLSGTWLITWITVANAWYGPRVSDVEW